MSMDELRDEIDALDTQLVELLSRRATVARAIGAEKRKRNAGIHDAARERDVLDHILKLNKGPLDDDGLRKIFASVISVCTEVQEHDGG